MISGWIFLLISLSIQVALISIYMISHFWAYIPVYRSSRIVFPILFIIMIYGQISLWIIVIKDISGQNILYWPADTLILLIVCYGILLTFYGMCIHLYGKNFIFRLRYRKWDIYGPLITFSTPDATNLRVKYWIKKSILKNGSISSPLIVEKLALLQNKPNFHKIDIETPQHFQAIHFFENYQGYIYEYSNNPIKEPWSFLVVGDLHAGGNRIDPLIDTLTKYYHQCKFMLALGDSVSDSQQKIHWKTFFGQMDSLLLQIPIIAIPGNHDGYMKKRYANWQVIFDQAFPLPELGGFHSIYFGAICFILLDNYNGSHLYTQISPEQSAWLDQELERASNNPQIKTIILGTHHPPFSTGEAGCNPELGPFFEVRTNRYLKIKLIFAGHCHLYQRFKVQNENSNVNYVVTGGGGGVLDKWITKKWMGRPYLWESDGQKQNLHFDLDTPKSHPLRNDRFVKAHHIKSIIKNHFLYVTVDQDCIKISVRSWENEEIEFFSIT